MMVLFANGFLITKHVNIFYIGQVGVNSLDAERQ